MISSKIVRRLNHENNIKNILLADDDKDDCLLFKVVVDKLQLSLRLASVNDGEGLMLYLSVAAILPDVIFMDLNMPRKNGYDCLKEIKSDKSVSHIPVVIFSAFYDEYIADELYAQGAHYYICKPSNFEDLKKVISRSIALLKSGDMKPPKKHFFINEINTAL